MRALVFEPDASGHREAYVRRIADVLATIADVTVAVPDELAGRLAGLPADILPLGARPSGTFDALDADLRRRLDAEVAMLERAIAQARPDHVLHLSGDAVLRRLARSPEWPARLTLLMFRPRSHYGPRFGSRLSMRERAVGIAFEQLLRRWRRRRDANAVLTLDPVAAERWSRRSGAPAVWLPEPPVAAPVTPAPAAERSGCALVGSLAARKGLGFLAADGALPAGSRLVLAGTIASGYERELRTQVARLEANGVVVELHAGRPSEAELLEHLAGARCALLPYPRHFGMSRVLVEASVARTPVVVHDFGLIGFLTREHGLGTAVDCTDPEALGGAVGRYLGDPGAVERLGPELDGFAARFTAQAFAAALARAFADRAAVTGAVR